MTDRGAWLADPTWPEAHARFERGDVVVVPIGAASEEQGRHLPLKADYLLARELSERLMARLPVVVAPIVSFGYFPAFAGYPASRHLRSETFVVEDVRIVVRDLCEETEVRGATADIRELGRRSDATLDAPDTVFYRPRSFTRTPLRGSTTRGRAFAATRLAPLSRRGRRSSTR